jgi:polyhydroxybutyrate depolymerase
MRFPTALLVFACVTCAFATGQESRTLLVGAHERTYELYVPEAAKGKKDVPLVLMLHGRGGSGKNAAKSYGWTQKADQEAFIAAFPDALEDPYQNLSTWNYVHDKAMADDTLFLLMLIISLKKELAVDPKRIYVVGHSNGAMMAYRAASELSDLIAAIAPVAGTLGMKQAALSTIKKPKHPVSVIAFHGKKDKVVPYEGGKTHGARDSVMFWVKQNECTTWPVVFKPMDDDELVIETFEDGKKGTEVIFVSVANGGHEWPGWKVRRWEPRAADEKLTATDMIWEFFFQHPKRE